MLKRRDREPSAGTWLLDKLAGLAASYTAPLPAPKPEHKPRRYQLTEGLRQPRRPLDEPPPGVDAGEWRLAQRSGGMPCTLTREQLRINDRVLLGMAEQATRPPEPPSPPPPAPTTFPSRFWK